MQLLAITSVLVLLGTQLARAQEAPLGRDYIFLSTSLCEAVAHANQYDKKRVKFRAKYAGTWEGLWLSDDRCDSRGELILPGYSELAEQYGVLALATKTKISLHDTGWPDFEIASRRLCTGITVRRAEETIQQGRYDYLVANFSGVIVIKRNFRFRNGFGNGWGHLGGSRFLLILTSVSNLSAHSSDCIPVDSSPPSVQFPAAPPPDALVKNWH